MENRDGCVTDRVMRKLSTNTPPTELVDAYLEEISKAYGVNWSPRTVDQAHDKEEQSKTDEANEPVDAKLEVISDTDAPIIKLPDVPVTKEGRIDKGLDRNGSSTSNEKADGKSDSTSVKVIKSPTPPPRYPADDFDELIKRFEALKKR
jgi:vacuolar protein sorting-associated protein IST1